MNHGKKENGCVGHDGMKKISDERIVKDYEKNHKQEFKYELDAFRNLSLKECIKNSLNYMDRLDNRWKRHPHQRLISKEAANKAIKTLLLYSSKISNANDFCSLHLLIKDYIGNINGIGDLYIYDTALRIGACLRKEPEKVYLHSGSLKGAINLLEKRNVKKLILKNTDFPDAFQGLKPYEIEHILCIYRNNFIPFASRPELNRTYFLTRIFRQPETDIEPENKERHKNAAYEKGKVTSAFLEPVFNDFSGKIFYENAEDIKFITDETNESLCSSVYNDKFNDGNFVKVVKEDGRQILISAEEDTDALFNKDRHKEIIEVLKKLEKEPNKEIFARDKRDNIKGAYSYHVNVGHGNTSFLIVCFDDKKNAKPVVVCIDCKRNRAGRDARNFNACVNYIKDRFCLDKFELDIFLLTHPHIDHYSGIPYLIKNRHITGDTDIWLNCRYDYPSSFYNSVLEPLSSLKPFPKVINPIKSNSSAVMNIWYPDIIIRRTGSASITNNTQIEKNPNNASVLTQFSFDIGGKKAGILFTGDIETEGWDKVKCPPYLGNIKNYCISHHGSKNGHERNFCHCGQNIKKITDCPNSIQNAILMGKDGAHDGIYYKPLLYDFGTRVKKTEDTRFLEIDLLSGCCYNH